MAELPSWDRIGAHKRRAGILAPLFSIYSRNSVGVGEYPDLLRLAEWSRSCGLSIIQLLPLNDVGGRFCPYDAESSFALEPMHLSLSGLEGVKSGSYDKEIDALRRRFPMDTVWTDPAIKREKLALLKKIFSDLKFRPSKSFLAFRDRSRFWLRDYALFRVLKEQHQERSWEEWPAALRDRDPKALRSVETEETGALLFQEWLQWQLFSQFSRVAKEIRALKVLLLGDLPFLVARDSADVWANRDCFKLGLSAGAPPDRYFEHGQEWGMPPYDWDGMRRRDHDYLRERLKTAESYYDMYRIDHFVGLLRIWVFPREGGEDRKSQARFDPPGEDQWEAQARNILEVMTRSSSMLPCAEDLGTVPDLARDLLKEYGIPGMDIQRWMRDWHGDQEFLSPEQYRPNAIATLSTHDMCAFEQWWLYESTEDDRTRFIAHLKGSPKTLRQVLAAALRHNCESASIFCIQSFQDWLALSQVFGKPKPENQLNRPGIVDEKNWRLRVPIAVEEWRGLKGNNVILTMVRESGREP